MIYNPFEISKAASFLIMSLIKKRLTFMWCRDEASREQLMRKNPMFDAQMLHPTHRRRFKSSQMGSIRSLKVSI
jgi:hypothetical protein